jgi:putative tryptophan/tyrosine transport system substrate-binding protein
LHIDYRFSAGDSEKLIVLTRELIALQPDVIVAQSTGVAVAVEWQTHAIPIVFNNVSDPIGSGLIASLVRPGGNSTGLLLYVDGIVGKWLAMLKEIAPQLIRAGLLGNPSTTPFEYFRRSAEAAAHSLGIEIVPIPVLGSAADIEHAFASFGSSENIGLVVLPDVTSTNWRQIIITLAAQYRLPAVYPFRFFVDGGGLMSYGTDRVDIFRLSAIFVDRILRGEKPADLPVETPVKYQTVVNLKTARAMGFSVPSSLLVRADEVIE